MNKKIIYFFLPIFFFTKYANSQNQHVIVGSLINSNSENIANANIVIKNIETLSITNFTTSNQEGEFKLSFKTIDNKVRLTISCLGYKTLNKNIELSSSTINVEKLILTINSLELEEVIIESEKNSVITKGDTTKYNISKFLNGTEENLKDVIKNLPGMKINENGKIEVNGKLISELLIDGENLYNSQHQFATENLSSKIVKSVEFYKNYNSFDRLKKDSITNETALNIIIKDEYKKKIKGHFLSENNLNNRFKVNSTLYNLNKKNKFSLIQNWNNLGDLPISLKDYFYLIENEENSNTDDSTVLTESLDNVPRFLKSGENVANKNNSFLNLSNIYTPNKKVKIQFYSITNNSSQSEINENLVKFTNSSLNLLENKKNNEKNIFHISNIKSVFKPSSDVIFKLNNYLLVDNKTNTEAILSKFNQEESNINQFNQFKNIKFENNISIQKKINKSNFMSNVYFNIEKKSRKNNISSNNPFLDLTFENDNLFKQQLNINKQNFGIESNYNFKFISGNYNIKIAYKNSSFDFTNTSLTNLNYGNLFKSKENTYNQEVNLDYSLTKKLKLSTGISNNFIIQNTNSTNNEQINYIGYSLNLKYIFKHNSILQLGNSFLNNLTKQDNLIENEYVYDYRTIITNTTLLPNTIFPINKINLNYLKSNSSTNNFLIVNLDHSWSNKSQNTNQITFNNYILLENTLSNKNENTNFFIYTEKKISKLPFSITSNIDINYSNIDYFINSNTAFFKSTYFSNSVSVKSQFKKSPIHLNSGISFSITNFNNNNIKSDTKIFQTFSSLNGLFLKNFYWKTSYSYNNYIIEKVTNTINIFSASLRYSKPSSNWEYNINAHNIFNLTNPVFVSNQTSVGYQSRLSNLNLSGYVNFGLKYKF